MFSELQKLIPRTQVTDVDTLIRLGREAKFYWSAIIRTGRHARWALELQPYNYEIEHRKGPLNYAPDALSRRYGQEGQEALTLATIAVIEDAWYNRMFANIRENLTEFPYWKIVREQLYLVGWMSEKVLPVVFRLPIEDPTKMADAYLVMWIEARKGTVTEAMKLMQETWAKEATESPECGESEALKTNDECTDWEN